jgi:acyl dehydratase
MEEIETIGLGFTWDQLPVGRKFKTLGRTITEADLHMELDIKGPTFAGDTVHVECEVLESRASNGKPGLGLGRTRNRVYKQDGTLVMEYTPLRLVKGSDFKAR